MLTSSAQPGRSSEDRRPRSARRRRRDLGRGLRALAGIDEDLLRPVWNERSRHTALGGVVLGTATIAAFSMWIAINESLGQASLLNLMPALIWFLFVLNLDRLLVTSMVGSGRRVGTLVMRIGVAVMFGFIIAEPLVMRIFQTAIEEHIREARTQRLDDLRGELIACNSEAIATNVAAAVPTTCKDRTLSLEATPASIQRELDNSRGEQRTLQQVVDRETAQLNALRDNANKECGGARGAGFTGAVGYGPQCRQRIEDANEYARTHPIRQNTEKLVALRGQIVDLEQKLGRSRSDFERIRDEKVDERVAEARSHQKAIGFLERLDALHELAGQSFALFIASWAIRLFFVAIDCLPVLVKFFGGTSGYDELFRIRSASAQRVFSEQVKTEERRIFEELEKAQDEAENRARMRRAELDLTFQEHKAEMKLRLGDAVRALAAELRQPAREPVGANGHKDGSNVNPSALGWPPR